MHNSYPAAVVLPVLYERLLLGCFAQNVGLARNVISVYGGKLFLFGIKIIFVFNRIQPWFVLDQFEYLHPGELDGVKA